jgi:arsenite methyltransferase
MCGRPGNFRRQRQVAHALDGRRGDADARRAGAAVEEKLREGAAEGVPDDHRRALQLPDDAVVVIEALCRDPSPLTKLSVSAIVACLDYIEVCLYIDERRCNERGGSAPMTTSTDTLRDEVRRRYAEAAVGGEGCCGPGGCSSFGSALYDAEERGEVPDAAVLASLGCGNPTAVADLDEGETVLDLGSGGGIDVILSARRVGPSGLAYGLDMTEEMLALARRNAEEAGVRNAIFLRGLIEDVPLPAASVDVVISNCVINLSVDKAAVFAELARVLKSGGRIGISDVVAEDRLSPEQRAERGSFVGCIAGALSKSEYEAGLDAAGFEEVSVEFTHAVADGLHGAIVKARRN